MADRWITIEDEYLCNGDSKYEKQKKQYSEDGTSWYDVEPLEVKRGDIIERYSIDCGYVEGNIVREWVLITDAYFKEFSPVPTNYNMEEIRPYYSVAEQLWVIPVLGSALYNELLQQVNDNQVTPLNSTLLLKIYAYEAIAITYEALPFISFHLSEVGITRGHSDNSDSITTNDVNFISTHLRNQLELLKKYLKKFLDDNAELYPLYRPTGTPCNCQCPKGDEWLWRYYFEPGFNKYDREKMLYSCMLRSKAPNPYAQLYSTRRERIDLI